MNWEIQLDDPLKNFYDVHFINSSYGWVVGWNGLILYTINGGESWVQTGCTDKPLNDIIFTDDEQGWIVGGEGIILHTDNAGATGFEEVNTGKGNTGIVNYPNPFTASTTIEYELQQPSTVQITIYNHLGKQVAGYAPGVKGQGSHTFSWQPRNLQAGVYYGVLRTESGIQTTKMIKME